MCGKRTTSCENTMGTVWLSPGSSAPSGILDLGSQRGAIFRRVLVLGPAPLAWDLVLQIPPELSNCPSDWSSTPLLLGRGRARRLNLKSRTARPYLRGKPLPSPPGAPVRSSEIPLDKILRFGAVLARRQDRRVPLRFHRRPSAVVRVDGRGSWPQQLTLGQERVGSRATRGRARRSCSASTKVATSGSRFTCSRGAARRRPS